MKKCLAPCNQACTPVGAAAYEAEATAVKRFFDTHGESLIIELGLAREEASNALHFERAAELHAQWHKVKAAQSLADELVQPIPKLRAVIVQKAAQPATTSPTLLSSRSAAEGAASPRPATEEEPAAAVFLMRSGCLSGPARLSTLGVRAVKEQTSVGSSLFAQPLMLEAVPLAEEAQAAELTPAESPEVHGAAVIAVLEQQASAPADLATLSDHLSLLRRWYYRPEKQRTGEVFFPREDGTWPIRRILRGAARVALGEPKPMAETHRELVERNPADEAQKPTHTKVLHEGRPDVERTVPVIARTDSARPKYRSRRRAETKQASAILTQDKQSLKNAILDVISDDYESLEHIIESLRPYSHTPDVPPNEAEIIGALASLVGEGYAATYLLSPQPPHAAAAPFSHERIRELWFYVTSKGRQAARNRNEPNH
jgi:hypothetical protein